MSLRSAKYINKPPEAHVKESNNKKHGKGHAGEIIKSHGQDHGTLPQPIGQLRRSSHQHARKEAHQSEEWHRNNTEDGAQVIRMIMLLECYWIATGMLLGCYWNARRPMSKSNKKEHAVVDTPGIQVVAALRSSCSEKQKGRAAAETDHRKVDTPSVQIRAGGGDPTQSIGPDAEEDPPGDSDDEWLDTALATAESTALATAEPDEGQAPPPPTDDEDVILQARQSPGHAKGTDEGRPMQRPPAPVARTRDSPAVTMGAKKSMANEYVILFGGK